MPRLLARHTAALCNGGVPTRRRGNVRRYRRDLAQFVCARAIRLNSPMTAISGTAVGGKRRELINPFIKAAAEDHEDADCLIVVAMSHGESGLLYSHDSLYPVDALWAPFTADRCASLTGKPKLFFIQVRRRCHARVSVSAIELFVFLFSRPFRSIYSIIDTSISLG